MKRKKIVLTLHSLGQGGTDRVACLLASGFAKTNYDTTLLIFCDGGKATEALKPLINDDVNIVFLSRSVGSRTIDLIRYVKKCAKYLARVSPDCVMSTGNNINWITAIAVWLSRIDTKLVLKTTNPIMNSKKQTIRRKFRRRGYKIAFRYSDLILPLSKGEREQLIKAFPDEKEKFFPVINPYVTPKMLAKPEMPSPYPHAKIVLGVGRFQKQKRFDLLIRSFALVKDPAAILVILGEGPEKEKCEAMVEDLHLTGRVIFPGFVSDVASWYHHAKAFVLTSDYEGLPAVILEALAANCPVIATDCFPAAHEILGSLPECKILEPFSIEDMAESIDTTISLNRPEKLHENAIEYSIENGILSHIRTVM